MIAAIVFGKSIAPEKDEGPRGPMVSEAFNLEEFNAVNIAGGAWEVIIEQGNEFYVEATYPKNRRDDFDIHVSHETLMIDGPKLNYQSTFQCSGRIETSGFSSQRSKKTERSSGPYVAKIRIPSLVSIRMDGSNNVVMNGFNEESLDIYIEGSSEIYAENSSVDNLQVFINGSGQADLRDLLAVNANVSLYGSSVVLLNMNGGVPQGILDGNEKSLDIDIDGTAKIYSENSSIDNLNVSVRGSGQADLRDLLTVDANINLDGVGEVLLNMNGGVLQGSLDGAGSISYKGEVLREEIEVNGVGKVVKED